MKSYSVRNKGATIKDIAQICGVSSSTVSRVLSASDYPVSPQIRQRVQDAARELGYRPAGYTRSGAEKEIAVLIPTIANPFYTSLVTGFESAVSKEDYNILLYNTKSSGISGERILQSVLNKEPKGLLVAAANMYPALRDRAGDLAAKNIKVVLADNPTPDVVYNSVYFDYEKGAYIGTQYLLGKGHQRIVYAGLELERESRVLRVQGFLKALRDAGLSAGDDRVLIFNGDAADNTQAESGEALAKMVLALPQRPTAVVVINDMVAFGMLRYFRQKQIKVPEEISVLGFDDSLFCETSSPALTTIKVQPEQMGRMAGILLLDELRGAESAAVSLTLEPSVVERGSVAPPSA